MLQTIIYALMLALLAFVIIATIIDLTRKRSLPKKLPFVSVIVPAYNSEKYIEATIKSVFNSYPKNKLELFVVNDASKDSTAEILVRLKKQLKFRGFKIFTNRKNKGKVSSVNTVSRAAKGEIIFIVDSDTIVSKKSFLDIVSRFQNKRVGGVSARVLPLNKGFLPYLQAIEYGLQSLVLASYNLFSAIGLWGGCMAIRKKAFQQIKGFSENAITEDLDAALKLNEKKWKVQESFANVLTVVPSNFKQWLKQKIRWASGGLQCSIKHYKVYLKNPIHFIFLLAYSFLTLSFFIRLWKEIPLWQAVFSFFSLAGFNLPILILASTFFAVFGAVLSQKLVSAFVWALFSLPYAAVTITKKREFWKIILIFPFSLFYWPVYALVSLIGFVVGAFKYKKLEKGERGW